MAAGPQNLPWRSTTGVLSRPHHMDVGAAAPGMTAAISPGRRWSAGLDLVWGISGSHTKFRWRPGGGAAATAMGGACRHAAGRRWREHRWAGAEPCRSGLGQEAARPSHATTVRPSWRRRCLRSFWPIYPVLAWAGGSSARSVRRESNDGVGTAGSSRIKSSIHQVCLHDWAVEFRSSSRSFSQNWHEILLDI